VATAEAEAKALTEDRNEAETEELRTALGAGGTGKGTAAPCARRPGPSRTWRSGRSRARPGRRGTRWTALIDLATHFRDALLVSSGADR
jgi:DNA polymerase-3 subunit delta'